MTDNEDLILDVIERSERDLSIKEIAERADVSRKTAEKYIPLLAATNRIVCTRIVGNAKFFDVPQAEA